MNELIKITNEKINGGAVQTVNARDLHAFLEVGRDFPTWIKDRIALYGFVAEVDYVTTQDLRSPNPGSAKSRPQLITEYHLALDMAKELAMVERNDRGKQARQYFIECERRLHVVAAAPALPDFTNPAIAARSWAEQFEGREVAESKAIALEGRVSELAPKADALDLIASAQGSMCITDAAKALQLRPKSLFTFLRSQGWLYRRDGVELGYQDKVAAGYLHHKTVIIDRDGIKETRVQVRVTPKGLTVLARKFPFAVLSAA